jgi:hypothetical protein
MIKNLCIAALAVFLLSSCCITRSPIMGILVTDVTVPSEADVNLSEVKGQMVDGSATAKGILGVVWGDASYETALQDALKRSGAKGLKNIIVDHHVKNVLGIVAEYTTTVRGIPIK